MKIFRKYFWCFLLALFISIPATQPQLTSHIYAQNASTTQKIESIVYITRTGSKYHRAGCRYLKRSAIAIDKSEAEKNFLPCKVCRP